MRDVYGHWFYADNTNIPMIMDNITWDNNCTVWTCYFNITHFWAQMITPFSLEV